MNPETLTFVLTALISGIVLYALWRYGKRYTPPESREEAAEEYRHAAEVHRRLPKSKDEWRDMTPNK